MIQTLINIMLEDINDRSGRSQAKNKTMDNKIKDLIKWAELRESAFTACAEVFETDGAKFKSIGRLEENRFWKKQLQLLLSDHTTGAGTEGES